MGFFFSQNNLKGVPNEPGFAHGGVYGLGYEIGWDGRSPWVENRAGGSDETMESQRWAFS
jgi:hypothetical protein